mmetsp:Transcript_36424/g.76693  ORF Transcript_36424/g.76693 Transcript_36424/m.76693 type:complete len:293 (+) Transcript_36424:333-1211(+)
MQPSFLTETKYFACANTINMLLAWSNRVPFDHLEFLVFELCRSGDKMISGEDAPIRVHQCQTDRIKSTIVQCSTHSLARRWPRFIFGTADVATGEKQLEQRGREAREHLRVPCICRSRKAVRVTAQVPEDDARQRIRLAAHGPSNFCKASLQPLKVRLPVGTGPLPGASAPAAARVISLIELHVGEDNQVRQLVGGQLRRGGRLQDELAREREIGRASCWCLVTQHAHLDVDGRVAVELEPTRRLLKSEDAVLEGGVRQLGNEDPQTDGCVHWRPTHRARHVNQRNEPSQVD